MLQKQKATARLEYPVNLGKCLDDMLDAAQRKRADNTIESVILEGKPFAAYDSLVNLDPRLSYPLLRQPVHPDVRIDRRDLADLGRVVRQVQARPEADLQHVAADRGEQFSAVLGNKRHVQKKVAEAGEDHLGVEAQGGLLIRLFSQHQGSGRQL